jgi:hypothetical protein
MEEIVDPKKLNKICDKIDTLKEQLAIKQKIIDEIEKLKAQCNGAPQFTIDASLPSLNINFAIYYFLKDILAVLGDLKIDEIRARILNWLVSVIKPLQIRLANLFKMGIRSCYTCKVQPKIGDWLFLTNPNTGQEGIGFNIKVEDIDERCLLKINPNSEMGKLKYDYGFNSFLWNVIQQAPATIPWKNPKNDRTIAHFTFLENESTAFTAGVANNPQTTKPESNVINMKIDDYYQTKTLTDFSTEYIDSILPLFDIESLFPNSIDSVFGTITKNLRDKKSISDACIEKEAEADAYINNLIEFGIDDKEVIVDDSFFEFTPTQTVNIKRSVEYKKKGQMVFTDCCNKKTASVSPETLIELGNQLSGTTDNGKKVEILKSSMDSIIRQTSNNVDPIDEQKAGFEFLLRLLSNITTELFKLTNSPKNKFLNQMMSYLVNGEIKDNLKDYYKATSCIWRNILGELLKKLLYELIIPWILKNLRPLLLCVLGKILKERWANYQLSIQSLIPGFSNLPPATREKITNALKGYNDITNFTNKLNVGEIKGALGLEGEGLGKFC